MILQAVAGSSVVNGLAGEPAQRPRVWISLLQLRDECTGNLPVRFTSVLRHQPALEDSVALQTESTEPLRDLPERFWPAQVVLIGPV